jgi:phosphotransferase system enzyme I (PtsI)
MAGSPFYVPILIGLGMVDLSMNVNSIPRVRKVIAGINYSDALDLVHKVETCKTADAIEAVLLDTIRRKWSHLFQSEIIDTRKS